jgi:hypothetical protein
MPGLGAGARIPAVHKRPAASAEQALPARGLAGQCARAAAVGSALGLAVTVFAFTIPDKELEA